MVYGRHRHLKRLTIWVPFQNVERGLLSCWTRRIEGGVREGGGISLVETKRRIGKEKGNLIKDSFGHVFVSCRPHVCPLLKIDYSNEKQEINREHYFHLGLAKSLIFQVLRDECEICKTEEYMLVPSAFTLLLLDQKACFLTIFGLTILALQVSWENISHMMSRIFVIFI